jgi:peptidoglycan/xylan/chitin deacetylase (PgdA/CDA1 family)
MRRKGWKFISIDELVNNLKFGKIPKKIIALTFDDGPNETLTPKTLDILKKYNIKATFFTETRDVKTYPDIVKRALNEGHIIANHSVSHPNFHLLSVEDQTTQIGTSDEVIAPRANSLKLFRYPYGNSTKVSNDLIRQASYAGIVGWHVDSCDWAYASKYYKDNGRISDKQATTCGVVEANVSNYAAHVVSEVKRRNGGIVLMHDVHENTVNSLEKIITDLLDEKFVFSNLDNPVFAEYFR